MAKRGDVHRTEFTVRANTAPLKASLAEANRALDQTEQKARNVDSRLAGLPLERAERTGAIITRQRARLRSRLGRVRGATAAADASTVALLAGATAQSLAQGGIRGAVSATATRAMGAAAPVLAAAAGAGIVGGILGGLANARQESNQLGFRTPHEDMTYMAAKATEWTVETALDLSMVSTLGAGITAFFRGESTADADERFRRGLRRMFRTDAELRGLVLEIAEKGRTRAEALRSATMAQVEMAALGLGLDAGATADIVTYGHWNARTRFVTNRLNFAEEMVTDAGLMPAELDSAQHRIVQGAIAGGW